VSLAIISEQIMVWMILGAVLAAMGLLMYYWLHRYRFSKRTLQLLEVIYDLAEGDSDAVVDSRKVGKRAGIAYRKKALNRLLSSGAIIERGAKFNDREIWFTEYSITPVGIQEVEQRRATRSAQSSWSS
jgi:hypothetical protein